MSIATKWVALKVKLRLIEDCKMEWRKFSTWIAAVGMALWGAFAAFPALAIQAWNMVPDDLRSAIPHKDWIAFGCLAAVFVAKFIRQGKPDGN